MSKAPQNLTSLPPDVQAFIAAQTAALARKETEIFGLTQTHAAAQSRLKAAMAAQKDDFSKTIQNRDTIIADLRMQLDGHKKHRFGSRSESSAQMALELILEEHEIAQAAEAADEDASSDAEAKSLRSPRLRKPFPKALKRVETRITPSDACTDCGGRFKELGADVMEELGMYPAITS